MYTDAEYKELLAFLKKGQAALKRVRPRGFNSVLGWLDTRGYKLSDRIWNVSQATAIQINALLEDAVNSGTSSLSLAKQMEQFLLPGRHLPRTDKPYGTDASFNALRLARTEITRSHSLSIQEAGMANPFVERMKYHLSAAHKDDPGDICEEFAAESEANDGFPKDDCPQPAIDSHTFCICYTTSEVIPIEDAISQIRDNIGITDNTDYFTDDRKRSMFEDAVWGLNVGV